VFRVLRHHDYRLLFGGWAVSLIGMWTTRVTIGWLVNPLTESAFMLYDVSLKLLAAPSRTGARTRGGDVCGAAAQLFAFFVNWACM
jgi:hypothetical protein